MLVLTRKRLEKITIGDNIILEVLSVDKKEVRIGIRAPREVPVKRGELLTPEQIAEIQAAARKKPSAE